MFKCIFLNENVWIPIEISPNFVPNGSINNNPTLFQIMAWRRPGDKPLSEPMMVNSLTHICVIRPQWVKDKMVLFVFNTWLRFIISTNLRWGIHFSTFGEMVQGDPWPFIFICVFFAWAFDINLFLESYFWYDHCQARLGRSVNRRMVITTFQDVFGTPTSTLKSNSSSDTWKAINSWK